MTINPYHWNYPPFHWNDASTNRVIVQSDDATGLEASLALAAANATATNPYYIVLTPSVYTVSTTLDIPSYTTIDLNGAILKGDATTNVSVIRNAAWTSGNTEISILNGVIDYNSTERSGANNLETMACRFSNCTNVTIRDVEVLDAQKYAFLLHLCDDVTIDGIDFNTNSDGIHFSNGGSRHYINNIKGYCGDDLVAYTMADFDAYQIDDNYADFTDIRVSNIYGNATELAMFKAIGGRPVTVNNTGIVDNLDGTFTVTTDSAHGLVAGDFAWIESADVPAYNNRWEVDSATSTTFTCTFSITGAHIGAFGASALLTGPASFITDGLIGATVNNTSDGSSGTITDNTTNTITATLSGGTQNDWDTNELFTITGMGDTSATHGTSGKSYKYNNVIVDGLYGSCLNIPVKLGATNPAESNRLKYSHIETMTIRNVPVTYSGSTFVQMLKAETSIYENLIIDISGKVDVNTSQAFLQETGTGDIFGNNLTISNAIFEDATKGVAGVVLNTTGMSFQNVFVNNVKCRYVSAFMSQAAGSMDGARIYLNGFDITEAQQGFTPNGRIKIYCTNCTHDATLTNRFVYVNVSTAAAELYGQLDSNGTYSTIIGAAGTIKVVGDIRVLQAEVTNVASSMHLNHADGIRYTGNGSTWSAF